MDPYGPEASAFTKSRLDGQTVDLEFDVQQRDRYGRLLAYVWIGNELFNATLLREGYAQIATYPPNVKYVDLFTQVQKEAREANMGLWGLPAEPAAPVETPPPPAETGAPAVLSVLRLTSPVTQGQSATITVQASPNAQCRITVTYKSGPSSAKGLEPKTAGANGQVIWTWTVGSNTTPGDWPIKVTCGQESIETKFTVRAR